MATCKLCHSECADFAAVVAHHCIPKPRTQSLLEEICYGCDGTHPQDTIIAWKMGLMKLLRLPASIIHRTDAIDASSSSEDDDNLGECKLHVLPDISDASSSEDDASPLMPFHRSFNLTTKISQILQNADRADLAKWYANAHNALGTSGAISDNKSDAIANCPLDANSQPALDDKRQPFAILDAHFLFSLAYQDLRDWKPAEEWKIRSAMTMMYILHDMLPGMDCTFYNDSKTGQLVEECIGYIMKAKCPTHGWLTTVKQSDDACHFCRKLLVIHHVLIDMMTTVKQSDDAEWSHSDLSRV